MPRKSQRESASHVQHNQLSMFTSLRNRIDWSIEVVQKELRVGRHDDDALVSMALQMRCVWTSVRAQRQIASIFDPCASLPEITSAARVPKRSFNRDYRKPIRTSIWKTYFIPPRLEQINDTILFHSFLLFTSIRIIDTRII